MKFPDEKDINYIVVGIMIGIVSATIFIVWTLPGVYL